MKIVVICIVLCAIGACKESVENQTPFQLSQVITDTLFDSRQAIHLLSIAPNSEYVVDLEYDESELIKTSTMAKKEKAVAAINAGFFDMKKGGSVTYLEEDNQTISNTKNARTKWAQPDSLINGVIIYTNSNELKIDTFRGDRYYENSTKENFAIASGPLLLRRSIYQKLPNMSFTHKRHPRTCLCKKDDSIIFIVIDGRSEYADGMSLVEAQKYLSDLGCIDAINLDGGGSSTMWMKDKGIVNNPSDKNGERSVANALLLVKGQ